MSARVDAFFADFNAATVVNPLTGVGRLDRGMTWHAVLHRSRGSEHEVTVGSIRSLEKGVGAGSAGLRFITELADKHGVTLFLFSKPTEPNGLPMNRLRSWYMRNGFVPQDDDLAMVRPPKSAEREVIRLGSKMRSIPMRQHQVAEAIDKTDLTVTVGRKARGIQYMEDLSVDVFLDVSDRFGTLHASEKMDGVALRFGFTPDGKFYTSRGIKGTGEKSFKATDWGTGGAANVFKAAHLALERQLPQVRQCVPDGEEVMIEVLYGEQPNAITYGLGGYSYIVFLKTNTLQTMENLQNKLNNMVSAFMMEVITSPDGETMQPVSQQFNFKFTMPEYFNADELRAVQEEFKPAVESLRDYLETYPEGLQARGFNYTASDLLNTTFTGKTREYKETVKPFRDLVETEVHTRMMAVKQVILDRLVKGRKPRLQRPDVNSPLGIEGVVFYDEVLDVEFKIVDKETFAKINRFNHRARDICRGRVVTTDPGADIAAKGGIYGDSKTRIINLLNVDGLSNPRSINKLLQQYKGADVNETVHNMTKAFHQVNVHSMRKKVSSIVDSTMSSLEASLDKFKRESQSYAVMVDGEEVGYGREIIQRTLLHYAETFEQLRGLKDEFARMNSLDDFVYILFGYRIEKMFNPYEGRDNND